MGPDCSWVVNVGPLSTTTDYPLSPETPEGVPTHLVPQSSSYSEKEKRKEDDGWSRNFRGETRHPYRESS